MHRQKKQSTPRRRARKNEDDGSLHFFHRPPERGLILHRKSVKIWDQKASRSGTSAFWEGSSYPLQRGSPLRFGMHTARFARRVLQGKYMHEAYAHGESRTPPPPSFSTQKNRCPLEYAHGSLRSPCAITYKDTQ